jgi:protein-S-isoprenylcysteine O-methyltransferase Ste14
LETSTPETNAAPWLYRERAMVIGIIYGVAFFFGYAIAGIFARSIEPAFHSFGLEPWLAAAAILLSAAGFALRVWASSYLPSSIVYHQDVVAEELRVSGPYRFIRNPLYLGNVLQAAGIGLLGPWPVFAILVIAMLVYSVYLIHIEEKFLTSAHGEAYVRYVREVPALIPVPGRALPKDTQPFFLIAGLKAQRYLGLAVLVVIAFVIWRWN